MVFIDVFFSMVITAMVFLSLTVYAKASARRARPLVARAQVKKKSNTTSIAALIVTALALSSAFTWDSQNTAYAQSGNDENFEIIKSTDNRVWRLNKKTGEVSVCTLTGDQLVCTDTSNAATPPNKTYEDIQEEAEAEQEKRDAEARAEQERQLTILDRFLDMIRELIHMSMGETAASE